MVIKFSDLGLEVPQFTLQVVTASLLIQEARILGEQELRKSSWYSSQRPSSCSALSIINLSFDYTVPASGQHHTQPNLWPQESPHRLLLLKLSPDMSCHADLLLKGQCGEEAQKGHHGRDSMPPSRYSTGAGSWATGGIGLTWLRGGGSDSSRASSCWSLACVAPTSRWSSENSPYWSWNTAA